MTILASTRQWTTCWKLTDGAHQTHNATRWGVGVENPCGVLRGERSLCSGAWYHAYTSPYLAVLLNPTHANITNPVLWQAEYRGTTRDDRGLKFGATELRTVKIVQAPVVTHTQRIAFAIYCAAQVLDESRNETWFAWAYKWLSGEDRAAAAYAAAYAASNAAAYAASNAAAYAASNAAAYAASNAAYAANAASNAAYAASNASTASNAYAEVLETAIAWALCVEP